MTAEPVLLLSTAAIVLITGAFIVGLALVVLACWRKGTTEIELANAQWLNGRLEDALRQQAPEVLETIRDEVRDRDTAGRHRR